MARRRQRRDRATYAMGRSGACHDFGGRQEDAGAAALADLALDCNLAPHRLHDAIAYGKPETGAYSDRLGSIKWGEEVAQILGHA